MIQPKLSFFIFIVGISITLIGSSFAQNEAWYFDRNVLLSDSLEEKQTQAQIIFATDGVIDPDEYYVGPGDVFYVSIRGIEEISNRIAIGPEGYTYLRKVGGVDLRNTTLSDAKQRIEKAIKQNFKNVEVFISLVEFKKIIVGLYGDVKKPGGYVLPGNARLSDLVAASHGLNQTSDLRNISIKSSSGKVKICDYIAFIRLGDKTQNPILIEGDYIQINKVDKTVGVSGSVKYPGIYEFKENEKAVDLIKVAGGFFENAELDSIEIISFLDDNKTQIGTVYSLNELTTNGYTLKNKDRIVVREKPQYLIENLVIVQGFVKYPGIYKIVDDKTTLSEIINRAGGFLDNASIVDAGLTRAIGGKDLDPEFERLKTILRADMSEDEYDYFKSKSRQRQGKVVVDFEKLFSGKNHTEDVVLRRGDVIDVPEKKNYITIIGQAVNPGKIPYMPEYTVEDYINLAGGYGWRAQESEVRVVKVGTGEWVDAKKIKLLEPGDTIWIPEDPPPPKFWDVTIDILTVLGQVATVIAATVAVIVSTR
ncbi:MAG TPA: SLBB domain-containing protein [Ignavibacteriaceae bacterium]|nr:SLBB domain-containing protein [Ignavibacteriaceae bacterium]